MQTADDSPGGTTTSRGTDAPAIVDWQRLKVLFEQALDLAPSARVAWVDAACADDPRLHEELCSLLAFDDAETGVLDQPSSAAVGAHAPADTATGEALAGQPLGPYRLTGMLGAGGMGVVYRAERADGAYEQVVAIKVLRRSFQRPDLVARFEQERQALAGLTHPNIARLLDGGTDAGMPYLVMEYVDGRPLDRFCDERRLSIRERLALFRTVCLAVQHAHQHLVVHRDLKPDNILVTPAGVPMLLDFGVAKILDAAGPEPADSTVIMTPSYGSPEQVRGETITTASDVFALGVLLHELLTGRQPFATPGASLADIQQAICTATPCAPSQVVLEPGTDAEARTGARGSTSARALARQLSGDLDVIVAMALRKEPDRRYASAGQLAEDVRRHLRGLPVTAQPDSWRYRAGKFVSRHRVRVAAATAASVGLLAGGVMAYWQYEAAQRARELAESRAADVRRLATGLIFEVHDAIVNVPGTTEARALMVGRAVEYLDRLVAEQPDDPVLRHELAEAFVRVGDAQGHPTSANIGDTEGAFASYEKAIALAGGLLTESPLDTAARRSRAMAERKLADVRSWMGDVAAAVAGTRRSLAEYDALADAPDATFADALQLGIAWVKLGDVLGNENFPNAGDEAGALAAYARARTQFEALDTREPGRADVERYVGLVFERTGTMHHMAGDLTRAYEDYLQSAIYRDRLAAAQPYHVDIRRDAAVAQEKLGDILFEQGNRTEGLERYRLALAGFEALYDIDRSNAIAARSLGISCEKLGGALEATGDLAGARRLLRRAATLYDAAMERDPANGLVPEDRARVAQTLARLAGRPLSTSGSGG